MKIKLILLSILLVTCACSKKILNTSTKENKHQIRSDSWIEKKHKVINYSGTETIHSEFLHNPKSVVIQDNNIIVAENSSNLIKKISNNGKTSRLAGNGINNASYNNLLNSSFNNPTDIIRDTNGNLYVTHGTKYISKINKDGQVSNFNLGINKYLSDEIKIGRPFNFIGYNGTAIDKENNIYIADGNQIKKISDNGKSIKIIVGTKKPGDNIGIGTNAQFNQIGDIATGTNNELYIVDYLNNKIKKVLNDSIVSVFKIFTRKDRFEPSSIDTDEEGNIYLYDGYRKHLQVYNTNAELIKIIKNKLLINSKTNYSGLKITVDNNNIYIPTADFINKIDTLGNITRYGVTNGFSKNGRLETATYYSPTGGDFDSKGNLYIVDSGNKLIRKITPNGEVSTYAGSGKYGSKNGLLTECSFKKPITITIDSNDNIYILEYDSTIRKIDNRGVISTWIDNKNEKLIWERAYDITCDSNNNIYVSDTDSNQIFKITTDKKISTLKIWNSDDTTNKNISIIPYGLSIDKNDNLYICDKKNNRVQILSKDGYLSILSVDNKEVVFQQPENITIDKQGNIFVTDGLRTNIYKINNKKEKIITIPVLGMNKNPNLNSYYNTLRINANNKKGNLFIFDRYDNLIRVIK